MTSGHATGRSVAAAVLLASVMPGVWSWQRMVCRARTTDVKSEPWEKIKTEYPIIQDAPETPQISSQTIDTMVQANPFSPARRLPPAPAGGEASGGGGEPQQASSPKFLFKGRINLGQRQRAIVEETTTHKTYFLEVGQEVAGCKVLDIAENRVVLSDPKTNQEVVVSLASPAAPAP